MPKRFKLEKIRAAVNEAFTDEELRILCYDQPEFVPFYRQLTKDHHRPPLINQLVDYAHQNTLLATLLILTETHNPGIYQKNQPYDSSAESAQPQTTAGTGARLMGRERILVADDDEQILRLCESILMDEGYQVVAVGSGRAAVATLRAEQFDLLLTDIRFPDLSGLDLIRLIKPHQSDLICVAMTGYPTQKTAIDALKLGFDEFLIKPFDVDQLILAISKVLVKDQIKRETVRQQALLPLTQLNKLLISTLDLSRLFEEITKIALDGTKADFGELYLASGDELSFKYIEKRRETDPVDLPQNLSRRFAAQIFASRKWVLSGLEGDKQGQSMPQDQMNWFAAGNLLQSKEKVLGVITLLKQAREFSQSELDFLEVLSHQAAIAVENALLYEEAQQREIVEREQRLLAETLQEVTLVLASLTEQGKVLDAILHQAQRLVPFDAANIMLLEGEYLRTARWNGYERFRSADYTSNLLQSLADLPLDEKVVRSRQALVISNVQAEPGWVEFDQAAWIRSFLIVPICLGETILGLLRLDGAKPNKFSSRDITQLQSLANAAAIALENTRLIEALKELDRKKTEFLSTVSHELRTPLTSIQLCLEMMLSEHYGPLTETQRDRLEIALISTREEGRLIKNLLDLARLQQEGDRTMLDWEEGSIREIIDDVTRVYQYDFEHKNIKLTTDPTEDPLHVLMDKIKIKQVVTNLISNALKYTKEGGAVRVIAARDNDHIRVEVRDTGIGIPPNEFKRIFTRFYQVRASSRRIVGGTGIGLNIVKEYIDMHGGQTWIESKIGQGSSFFFTLPTKRDHKEES